MKLAAGNPNLMRKAALRVNPTSTLSSVRPSIGDKERARYRTGAKLTDHGPNAAQPRTISVWEQPVYVPDSKQYVRPGAHDFLNIKSRGL